MPEILTCDRIREAVHGYVSDCCPTCHSSVPGGRMALDQVRVLRDGTQVQVCCRVASNLQHHGLLDYPGGKNAD